MIDSDSTALREQAHNLPADIFVNPPPNQNPLIGISQGDTLANLRDCITLLGDLALYQENSFNTQASRGFYHLMACVNAALSFEAECREVVEGQEVGSESG